MSVNQKCKLWIPQRLTACMDKNGGSSDPIKEKNDILVEITLLNIIRSDVYKDTTYTNDVVAKGNRSKRNRSNTVSMVAPPMTPMPLPSTNPRTSNIRPTIESPPDLSPPLQPHRGSHENRPSIDLNLEQNEQPKKEKKKKKKKSFRVVVSDMDDEDDMKVIAPHHITPDSNNSNSSDNNSLDLSFPMPHIGNEFGGHINHQVTDVELVHELGIINPEHDLDMKLLMSEMGQNNHGPTMNLATPRMDIDDDGKSYVSYPVLCSLLFISIYILFIFLFIFIVFVYCVIKRV